VLDYLSSQNGPTSGPGLSKSASGSNRALLMSPSRACSGPGRSRSTHSLVWVSWGFSGASTRRIRAVRRTAATNSAGSSTRITPREPARPPGVKMQAYWAGPARLSGGRSRGPAGRVGVRCAKPQVVRRPNDRQSQLFGGPEKGPGTLGAPAYAEQDGASCRTGRPDRPGPQRRAAWPWRWGRRTPPSG